MRFVFFVINKLKADNWGEDHTHNCWEIVYNANAAGMLCFKGQKVPYQADCVFVHPPRSIHNCYNEKKAVHYCIGLAGPELGGLREGMILPGNELKTCFEEIVSEINARKPFYKELIELKSQELIIQLKRDMRLSVTTPDQEIPSGVKETKKILDSEYNRKVDLTFLSNEVMLSADYLRHEFKKHYGVSPIQYLINRRIEYAKFLLNTSKTSIKEIAYQCGFENEFYFSRIFKRFTGASPKSYRSMLEKRLTAAGFDEKLDPGRPEG